MQLSDTKTDHIIFKADAFDEATFINCAIVHIHDIMDSLIEAHIAIEQIKERTNVYGIRFWNDAPYFFDLDEDAIEGMDMLTENKHWSYLDITDDEFNALVETNDYCRTEAGILFIDTNNDLKFSAYIKNTGIEVATERFRLADIIADAVIPC